MRRRILKYLVFVECPQCCVGRNLGHLQRIGIFHRYQYNDARWLDFHFCALRNDKSCTTIHLGNLCLGSELVAVTNTMVTDILL